MRIVLLLLCSTLSGCFFFYIPGSFIDSLAGQNGRHCVGETAKVGDRIKFGDGSTGVIERLEGRSDRCQNPAWPVKALVTLDTAS